MVVEAREGAVREAVVMKVGETEGAVREVLRAAEVREVWRWWWRRWWRWRGWRRQGRR